MGFMTMKKLVAFASALLLLVLLILQFMPFWQYPGTIETENPETGKKEKQEAMLETSIQNYVWFPEDNKDCTKYLESAPNEDNFACGNIVLFPALTLILALACVVCTIIKPDHQFLFIFPLAAGALGVWSLMKQPVFALGNTTLYVVQMVISAVLVVLGFAGIIFMADTDKKEKPAA